MNDEHIQVKHANEVSDISGNARRDNSNRSGGRLVRRTFIVALVLLTSGFIAGGAIELVFRYQESVNNIWELQTEMAKGAAFKIQQFMQGIEKTMRASSRTQAIDDSGLTKDFEIELIKLSCSKPHSKAVYFTIH